MCFNVGKNKHYNDFIFVMMVNAIIFIVLYIDFYL